MSFLFPRVPRAKLFGMFRVALLGALFAGAYGAIHDQISYSISQEYFTKVKFRQFSYADFGFPERVFVAEVGILASAWVGLVAAWLLARAGLCDLVIASGRRHIVFSFAIVATISILSGLVGALMGVAAADGDMSGWNSWQSAAGIQDLRGFIIVAYLHTASYLGALSGLIATLIYVRRRIRLAQLNRAVPDTNR